jgi:predicted enzyme related to lactoylglutathione lyase
MYAIENDIAGEQAVTMDVTDPARSQEFYQDLFGLVLCESATPSAERVLAVPDGDSKASLIFRPRSASSEGAIWLSVEVSSVSEVLDLYLLAIMMGAKAMLPRKRGSRWATVVTDPDGNRISVWTKVDEPSRRVEALHPVRWEWKLSQEGDHLFEEEPGRIGRLPGGLPAAPVGGTPGRMAAGVDHGDRRTGGAGADRRRHLPASATDKAHEGKE